MAKNDKEKGAFPTPKGNVYGYMRVSTEKQDAQLQLDALTAAGVSQKNIFSDKISGSKIARHGLEKCLKTLNPGDTLLVWKVDRLGRSLFDMVNLMRRFEADGVGFKSLTQPIDTTNPAGRLMLQMLFAFAEFERETIRERVKAGISSARIAKGIKKWGRRSGSEYNIKDILRRRRAGYTMREIAKALGISHMTVRRVLNANEVLTSSDRLS